MTIFLTILIIISLVLVKINYDYCNEQQEEIEELESKLYDAQTGYKYYKNLYDKTIQLQKENSVRPMQQADDSKKLEDKKTCKLHKKVSNTKIKRKIIK